jgi:hypothetical protein
MNKFLYKVELEVEVEAFDEDDAAIVIKDYIGPGFMDSILNIKSLKIKK